MCGISGFRSFSRSFSNETNQHICVSMTDSLLHRGPDDFGLWQAEDDGVYLGFRRLAIQDLSAAGHQPMVSPNGRYVMVFNGEIYNHQGIRDELKLRGEVFKGHSDTETIVSAFEAWGIDVTLKKLIGMFAIALWDREEKQLTLIRDRLGIKPLYWSNVRGNFVFGSELRSIIAHPSVGKVINRQALTSYMRFGYVPAPMSIYDNVFKLEPGHTLTLKSSGEVVFNRYWKPEMSNKRRVEQDSELQMVDRLENLISDAVKKRMLADVPLGAFLSGGVDSSLVVALMQSHSSEKIKTYSIGFREENYDEAPVAREVSRYLGTNHTEFYIEPKAVLDDLHKMSSVYDEPFADPSQLPTYIVSKIAREEVTVALSGDGGDELFGGYERYKMILLVWQRLSMIGPEGARFLSGILQRIPSAILEAFPAPLCEDIKGKRALGWRKFASLLSEKYPDNDIVAAYLGKMSFFSRPGDLVVGGHPEILPEIYSRSPDDYNSLLSWMQSIDVEGYLHNDLLAKVDRASMANSLEVRVPLLDHRIVEESLKFEDSVKLRGGISKWPLKEILRRHLPDNLVFRPKKGFSVPLKYWLASDLRPWVEDLLAPEKIKRQGYLKSEIVQVLWRDHLERKHNNFPVLWNIIMFQAWLDRWE